MPRNAKLLAPDGTIDLSGEGIGTSLRPRNTKPLPTPQLADDGWHKERTKRQSVPPFALEKRVRNENPTGAPPIVMGANIQPTAPPPAWLQGENINEEALWLHDMKERYELGDFTGALGLAELMLGRKPQHSEALAYRKSAKDALIKIYANRLGNIDRVFKLAVPKGELHWRGLDQQAQDLILHVDGMLSLREVVVASRLDALLALRLLFDLMQSGVIAPA